MFGLENQKKKKKEEEFAFELETELKDGKRHKELKAKIEDRIQAIKEVLRVGDSKDDFDKYGALLHGYTSLLKVMARFTAAK